MKTFAPIKQSVFLSSLSEALHAAIIMAIGMGFGRFAFTAVYPHMVEEGLLTVHGASLAASANYAGYLIGALLCIRVRPHNAQSISILSIAGTAICLAALAVLDAQWEVVALRGVAGVFSAMSMVAGSIWLFEHRQQSHRAPLLYGGVGVGIALSAELLVLATSFGMHSRGMWLILASVSAVLGMLATRGLLAGAHSPTASVFPKASKSQKDAKPVVLVLMYTLAGFGYIVTATYLPLLVKTALPELNSAHVWAIFGLGAAPSCLLWHRVHERLGTRLALMLNLLIQAIGVVLPVVANNAIGYLLCALLVGGTFVGTVTIAMPAAQRIAKKSRGNLMAMMTIMYGLGQIAWPVLSTTLYRYSHTFSYSLIAAASALAAAAVAAFALEG